MSTVGMVKKPGKRTKVLISIVLITILGSMLYINSLGGKFVYDDHSFVNWSKKMADEPIEWKIRGVFHVMRPLTNLSLMASYYLWGQNVLGYHITNVVLHVFVALSVFWLIIILFDDWLLAALAGILFVAHPVQVESVAFISNRAGVMSALFTVLCLVFYIKNTRTKNFLFFILTILSAACAVLSKEDAIIIPMLLLLFHFAFKERFNWGLFLSILLMPFAALLAIGIREGRLPQLPWFLIQKSGGFEALWIGLLQGLPGFFAAIANYVRILLFPIDLRMQYGQPLFNFTDPRVIAGIAIAISMLIYAFRKREKNSLIFFSVCWFFIALLPANNIIPHVGAYMREHWLYLPLVGFCLLVAHWFSFLYRNKAYKLLAIIMFSFIIVFYSYLTVRQNTFWRSYASIAERILQVAPKHGQTSNMLGVIYVKAGKAVDAIPLFKQAIESEPGDAVPYNNLGNAYFILGRYGEAMDAYKGALKRAPYYAKVYNNIGETYSALGRHEEAIAAYNKAIELVPEHVSIFKKTKKTHQRYTVNIKPVMVKIIVYNNLGAEYTLTGNPGRAEDAYKKAIEVAPWHAEAYFNLGNLYISTGRVEEAIDLYNQSIKRSPNDISEHKNLGNAYSQLGQTSKALASYKRALEIDPYDAGTYYNISLLFFREKEYGKAVSYCDRAVELGYRVPPSFLEKIETYKE